MKEMPDLICGKTAVGGNYNSTHDSYYVNTVGKNAKKIQEYIQNQLKENLEYDQMTLKEYIDPFTGEPVKSNK